jgi:hypothetical protein
MIIYVSGRVTGMPNYNREAFAEAEAELSKAGHTVLNPVKYIPEVNPEAITHRQYVDMGLAMLDCCDAIYLLDGWEKSKGAVVEYAFALQHGIKILTEVEA